ncbi:MAG: tellurite resistance protein TerC [Actinomycetota bacterium]|jgi:tellurite resistance protein TerC|nr:tellurite resistance protein TerC [Actinomycetota bacterium]
MLPIATMTPAVAADTARDFASFDVPLWLWFSLVGAIVVMLVVDLLLVHRTAHVITIKEAAIESAVWISIGLAFGVVLLLWQGGQAGGEYYAGFLIEKSLSIDNVFVWAVIFSFFAVPRAYQFRVLFWGIFGALVLRGIFIFAGVSLIERFEWVLYLFGAFLLYTAWKIAHHDETKEVDYNANIAMRLVRRIVPTTPDYDGQKLFTRKTGTRLATPLFAVLVLIEATDVVFAVDSVPAILAVSREPFIVFASNAFAILGLRSLYFLLGGMQGRFRYLNIGLGVILAFVGVKMLLIGAPFHVHLPTPASLGVIAVVIAASVVASMRADARDLRDGIAPGAGAATGGGDLAPPATDPIDATDRNS